ncbi:sugar kinase [Microbacterium telephonicum]|uniref:2-dehydro-3-deoxygluconokinase n=1 Tax=Microbacterium telephonicum TaxID=1714841 RepID=A0A498CB43_9MICO|nr:sugar kinase [Microbacterium telephonicum]RLK52703.1 2-dehydro-3-deoxygluconokinase [Microbacterium telephonicum]
MSGILLAAGETMAMVAPLTAEAVPDAAAFRVDAGGAESNVAGHVAALGHPARWVSRLGDDPLGHRVAAQLAARGIDLSAVVFDPQHRTGLYVKNPGRGVHYYRDGSAAAHLDAADADAVDLDGVAIVHVSGITAALGDTAPAFLDRLVDRAREAGIPVSFDVNHRAALWPAEAAAPVLQGLARRADIVFVGRDEAETLWGTATAADVRALLPEVAELVVKDGEIGATVFEAGTETFVASVVVDVVEPVGAGDAFAGGYLAARLSGAPADARLAAGHARAALTLQTTGDVPDADIPHPLPESEPLP